MKIFGFLYIFTIQEKKRINLIIIHLLIKEFSIYSLLFTQNYSQTIPIFAPNFES